MLKKVRFNGLEFPQWRNNVYYYDPEPESEFTKYIEAHYDEVDDAFRQLDMDFCYFPYICKQITEQQIKYRIPNWNGEPLRKISNDFLKDFLPADSSSGPCLLKKTVSENTYECFPLKPLSIASWEQQIEQFELEVSPSGSYGIGDIRFSIVCRDAEVTEEFPVYNKKFCIADDGFNKAHISDEIAKMIEELKKSGIDEFVLRCMVPIESKLSKIIITPKCEIMLPDYGIEPIEMSPLPKALFLLFLKHDEGIYFKNLDDYRKELQIIYAKITNRVSDTVISDSIEKITNPLDNAVNEKCSRIREAFLKRMDERVANHYYVTGQRGEKKRITLPRDLVEWQCEI